MYILFISMYCTMYNLKHKNIKIKTFYCCFYLFFFKNLLIALCQTENFRLRNVPVNDEQILLAPWFLLC